jgi:RNA polymerase sigma factor (TIGR02999 family)
VAQPAGEITLPLRQWPEGSREAENQLFALVMPGLRRLAHHFIQSERKNHSLQATELVEQIYFRMVAARHRNWQNRKHLFAIAAGAMRRYLIDHARERPSAEFVALEEFQNLLVADSGKLELTINVDRLLDELAETKPEWSVIVEMKFFPGLTDEEVA